MNENKLETNDNLFPRLCQLIKWPDFVGYGFNLESNDSIGKVDEDSPAMLTCLREGDILIEVNGVNVSNKTHEEVVKLIKSMPNKTCLLVVDKETEAWYKNRNMKITSDLSNIKYCSTPVPRPELPNACNIVNLDETTIQTEIEINLPNDNTVLSKKILEVLDTKQTNQEQIDKQKSEEIIVKELDKVKIVDNDKNKENNNNNEKTTNQNLITNKSPAKLHNFIVVNSEEQFALEKRLEKLKQEQENEPNNQTNKITSNILNNSINLNESNNSNSKSNQAQTNLNNQSSLDLNLNMSASEMRKLIASRRNLKTEAKKAPIDLRQKYEIIQQM